MDKYEHKVKIEEIKNLIAKGDFCGAADIADTVDWSLVKNIPILGMVSDVYKKINEYETSREILTYAYKRQKNKAIVKSLCELSIQLGDLGATIDYLEELKAIAPQDSSIYILQYKSYKSQNISIEEQIEVLEKLKEVDYIAKWAYELATLYHRAGMESKCVDECNEIILWVVDGKYVLKAYELKAQHQPLTEGENYKYEVLRQAGGSLNIQYSLKENEKSIPDDGTKEFSIGSDVSPFNTQNLQAVVAEGIQDVLASKTAAIPQVEVDSEKKTEAKKMSYEEAVALDEAKKGNSNNSENEDLLYTQMYNPVIPEEAVGQELEQDTQNTHVNFSDSEILGDATSLFAAERLNTFKNAEAEYALVQNTDEIKPITAPINIAESDNEEEKIVLVKEKSPLEPKKPESSYEPVAEMTIGTDSDSEDSKHNMLDAISSTGVIETFHKGSNLDGMLSQGYDGQISMVIPDEDVVEKQITGQLSIDDVMLEWERKKKESEEKLIADVKDRIRNQTATLFENFNEATKSSLLEQIEGAMVEAALKEEHERIAKSRPKEIKVRDIEKPQNDEPAESSKPVKTEEVILPMDGVEEIEEIEENIDALPKEVEEVEDIEENFEGEENSEYEELPEDEYEEENPEYEELPEDEYEEENSEYEELPEDEYEEENSEYEELPEDEYEEESEADEEYDDTEDEENERQSVKKASDNQKAYRELTNSEKKQFAAFINRRSTQRQLVNILDNVSLASYTGNILVAAEENNEVTTFSKLLIQEIQMSDSNFVGKVAMISGDSLNRKEISRVLEKVKNGAMIITEPQNLKKKTLESLVNELNRDGLGVVIILQGTGDVLDKITAQNKGISECFNLRIDLKAFDDKTLAEYAKNYAYTNEYVIDDFGLLALHTRISDMQTADHDVTLNEIEELVDEAIYYADRKTPAHFFDILFGKRYNEDDMVILREKDFMHN